MSKQLTLIRHCNAGWPSNISDHERMLTPKGEEECLSLVESLKSFQWQPNLVTVSSATRTQQTKDLILQGLALETEVLTDQHIYQANVDTLMKIVSKTPEAINHLVVIGHNPGISELANMLDDEKWSVLCPGGIVHLSLETKYWQNIHQNTGHTLFSLEP